MDFKLEKYRLNPVLEPETSFEKFGTVNNVVFATGIIEAGDELFVYCGCADTVIGVVTTKTKKLLDYVLKYRS